MKRQNIRTLTTFGVLAAAGASAFLLPQTLDVPMASAAPMPLSSDTIQVTGTVRDFKKEHVDFDVTPSGGNGHYAGNLALTLNPSTRVPVLNANGFKVATQWRDRDSHNIAPHLYKVTYPAAVTVVNSPTLSNSPVIDTFYSNEGPYAVGNTGPAPQWVTGSPMPTVSAPTGMPAVVNEFKRDTAGTTTINAGKYNYNKFDISNGHVIRINGAVTLHVNELFKLNNVNTRIELLTGATLDLYYKKDATVQDRARLHIDTSTPHRVKIYNIGSPALPFIVQNQAHVSAHMVSPNSYMLLQDQAHFYGRFTGKEVHMQNNSGLHIDVGSPADNCGLAFNDSAGSQGVNSTGGITSAASYGEWYRDTLGSNLSGRHTITLTNNGSGIYEYVDDAFFPIDDIMFGNEGDAHNYFFTYTFTIDFVHRACENRFFEFEGADDAWVFIGEDLVMDLGGVLPSMNQRVPMDRFAFVDGQTYTLRFFYAQRNPTNAVFRVRTNLDVVTNDSPVVASAGWD